MNTMPYLFAAYLAIWIILAVYLLSIWSREKKLREEVRRLEEEYARFRQACDRIVRMRDGIVVDDGLSEETPS